MTEYPHAKNAMVLAAVLQPGDALYIPVGWWHYIEADVGAGLSVGVNAFAYAHREVKEKGAKAKSFIAHPCDPDDAPKNKGFSHAVAKLSAAIRAYMAPASSGEAIW